MFNKLQKSLLALFIGVSTLFVPAFAENSSYLNNENKETLQGYALFVPAGITCDAVLSQEINSLNAVAGQTIGAILMEDFLYNDSIIATKGSIINGTIISNRKAGYGNKNARMQIRFTTIRTPYNNIIPISAVIVTSDLSGVLKGGSTMDSIKDYTKSVIKGAGSGAAIGTVVGAVSKNKSVGEGALYGVIAGATIGVIDGIIEKGENILIPANSQISLYFDQPITLSAQ